MDETPRRAGYREVWMKDPRMGFRCGDCHISLRRRSGGYVSFSLFKPAEVSGTAPFYAEAEVDTTKKFEKLWDFLIDLK